MPATVASIMIGNALLVPVLSASIGVSPSPGAAARMVPSPPSSTTAAEHRWAIIRAYSVVSVADPVGRGRVRNSISGSRTRADGGAARSRRTSRSTPAAIPKASVDSSTRSTPSAPTARMIRSTIDVFSVFGKTDACATTRRMSLPDIGFGMIPTALPETTGVGCSATVPPASPVGLIGSLQRVCDRITGGQELQGVAQRTSFAPRQQRWSFGMPFTTVCALSRLGQGAGLAPPRACMSAIRDRDPKARRRHLAIRSYPIYRGKQANTNAQVYVGGPCENPGRAARLVRESHGFL